MVGVFVVQSIGIDEWFYAEDGDPHAEADIDAQAADIRSGQMDDEQDIYNHPAYGAH